MELLSRLVMQCTMYIPEFWFYQSQSVIPFLIQSIPSLPSLLSQDTEKTGRGRKEEWKEGRKEGRKRERKEGRKEVRKEENKEVRKD